jgi:hypothetical protein
MNTPDFSGIDPLRVPEARRRVAALNEYLSLPNPSSNDTLRIAASIGLSRSQFCRLARVWRDHRDASLLVVGKRGPANRKYNVDHRAISIAQELLAEAGPTATLALIAPQIEQRCAEAGISPPARSTINNYIKAARAGTATPAAGPPRIVVGRMWFHIPIAAAGSDDMPTLLTAVLLPERIVVEHGISADPLSPPSVNDLIDRLAGVSSSDGEARKLLLDPDDRRVGSEALSRAGLGSTRSYNRSVQRELSKAFGGSLGPLAVIHQRGMARPATKRVITRHDEKLPAENAVEIIENAVLSHNASICMAPVRFSLAPY